MNIESISKIERAISSTYCEGFTNAIKSIQEWLDLEYKIHSKTAGGISSDKLFKDISDYIANMKEAVK